MYILKRTTSASRRMELPQKPKMTREQELMGINGKPGYIERGKLTDGDIDFILNSGDKKLIRKLDEKYKREKVNSEHVKRIYGNAFDNKDNKGNLYKEVGNVSLKKFN